MHAGSNPAARTRQSQSSRSPYRGAGRLFRTRFAGSTTFCRCFMICGSLLSIPFRLSNLNMRFPPSHISPPPVPFSRTAASEESMRSTVPLFYSVWRDAMPLPPRVLFPMGGEARSPLSLHAFLSAQSASRLPPRFAFRRTARRLLLSAYLYGRRGGRVFRAHIRFPCRFRLGM